MNNNATAMVLKCPVCGARFRGTPACSRCGTDLESLMRLAAGAWVARQQARAALFRGDLNDALTLIRSAQHLQRVKTATR